MFNYFSRTLFWLSVPLVFVSSMRADAAGSSGESTEAAISIQQRESEESKASLKQPLFPSFTGKTKGAKVRVRSKPDLESYVVKELPRDELVSVVGERGDFYAVEPPSNLKAYVFRGFILDGKIEVNRVNVRIEPSLDAPVIGQLNQGDLIKGSLSSLDKKWYEIDPPKDVKFYIAKEFVERIGGPEVKTEADRRRKAAEQLFGTSSLFSRAEMNKPFEEIDIKKIQKNYQSILDEYPELKGLCSQVREALQATDSEYIQRKISYLEEKNSFSNPLPLARSSIGAPGDRMKIWEPIEEALYISWASLNQDRSWDEFYDIQREDSQVVSGILDLYNAPIKGKPGDFILKNKDLLPLAYLYSTQIDLHSCLGKQITVSVAPRPNNNFAFPAYFVLSVEEASPH